MKRLIDMDSELMVTREKEVEGRKEVDRNKRGQIFGDGRKFNMGGEHTVQYLSLIHI